LALVAVSCATIPPVMDVKVELTEERIARGEYLVEAVVGCGICHTPGPQGGALYLEGDPMEEKHLAGAKMEDPDITAYSANITQDVETGIGSWTDGEIIRAIREGVNKGGKVLFPLMPYVDFKDMSDNDVRAIVAYLRTVPPVKNKVPEPRAQRVAFPLNILIPLFAGPNPPVRDVPDPPAGDPVARGKYLTTLGGCLACHTSGYPFDMSKRMAGGTPFKGYWGTVYAANLTPDPETGVLKKYKNDEEIIEALRAAAMKPPMRFVADYQLKYVTDEDMRAIIAYLRSLPPIKNKVPEPEGYIEE